MADEQVIVDIKVDSDDVKKADKRIDELTDSIEELGNRIKTARNQNKQYKKEQQELNEQYKQGKISTEQFEKGIDKINKKINVNNRIIVESQTEMGKLKRERTANIKLINSESSSLAKLEAQASLLNQQITKQSKATKEGREEFARLEKELGEVNAAINKQRKSFNDYTKNIGNYPEVSGPAVLSIRQLGEGMENVGGASATAVGGVKTLGAAFKALLANPVVLVISLIVAGLSALFSAFKRSESGSKLLGKAMAGLRGIMAVLTKVADMLGDAFSDSMEESKESSIGFWDYIKKTFIRRLEGLLELMKSIGDGISAIFSGSADDLEKASERAKNAMIQIGTGLNEAEFDAVTEKMKELAEEAANIAAAFVKLEEAQRASRSASRFLEKDIAKLQASFDQLSESAGDDTQSLEAQRNAAIEAGKVAAQLAAQEEKLARTRLSIINQEVATRRMAGEDIQDILDDQAQAQVALTDAVSKAAIAQQKILIEQRKIERDLFEQNLDILIDVGDKIKTEQEKVIQDESLTLEKRKQLLASSRAALTANFNEIKKEYELYGVTAEQINDVISASDAKQTNERLRALGLNEIAVNRLREIILERRQAEIDFNDLQKDLVNEEVERRQTANEKIKEINDENAIAQIEDAEELRDALIELEREKLEMLLEDETLLEEERALLKLESEQRISEIEEEFNDERDADAKDRADRRRELIEETFAGIISATEKFAGKEAAIFSKIAKEIATSFEDGKISATEALGAISNISNALFESQSENRAIDLAENEEARKKELELAEGNADAQDQINKKYDKIAAGIKLKQFNADKAKALLDIAIQTALAITKSIAASPLTGGLPFTAIVAGLGAAQAAIVAAKKAPKFGKGTSDIVNIGDSHASGNDVDVWGFSGNQKQFFGKVERGEAMPVIRKNAVNDYMVAKMNGRFSPSNGRKFQDGTPDITSPQTEAVNNQVFLDNLVTAFENVQIVTKVEDITKALAKKAEIVDNSKV